FDALAVAAHVEGAFDPETALGRRRADQLEHGKAVRERAAAPVLRDMAEQPVLLDLVPLGCAGRIVVDVDQGPVSSASFCSSSFHSRTRAPLEPPECPRVNYNWS